MSDTEPTPAPSFSPTSRRLLGATAGMALGTLVSRVTGLLRVIAQTTALGGLGFADSYNLANTTPNIITDIVVGGVLSATFVPVFVDYLSTRDQKDAWRAISAVVTVTVVVLTVSTVVFFVLAGDIVRLYTVSNHSLDVHQEQQTATFLLRWFVPQLACYGLIALFTALLNARDKFALPMFVPIANNLVVIGVLVWFHRTVPHPSLATVDAAHHGLVLLGFGTTLGVVVQTVLLVPSLVRADLHLRFRWEPGHQAMRTVFRLGGWTFGWVLANQVALFVVLALADGAALGAVSAYTYAYQFFLLPYGIVAVSVMSAVTPTLSARWAAWDLARFRHRMAFGLRGILAVIIPSAVGMIILAQPLIDLVLAHGAETTADAQTTASTLAMFALGLPGFCTFLYMVRVFQAMQDTRTAFKLYLVENGLNVAVAVALVHPLGVRGLALSVSIAYSAAALLALAVVRQRVGGLGGSELVTPVKRTLIATAAMAVTTVAALNAFGGTTSLALLGRLTLAIAVGIVTFVGAVAVVGARSDARRRTPSGPRSTPDRDITAGAFHDRLDDRARPTPFRHLRAVHAPEPGRAGSMTDVPPGNEEEVPDGPHPGGDR